MYVKPAITVLAYHPTGSPNINNGLPTIMKNTAPPSRSPLVSAHRRDLKVLPGAGPRNFAPLP